MKWFFKKKSDSANSEFNLIDFIIILIIIILVATLFYGIVIYLDAH